MIEKPRIGFIGAGRVGKALALGFSRSGAAVVAVASRTRSSAVACAEGITGCEVLDEAQNVVDRTDLVFLAVPDGAIATLAANLRWRPGMMVAHCSGGSELAVLDPAKRAGAQIGSFHPLVMIADREVALRAFSQSAIALEAEEPMLGVLESLVRGLGAQSLHVPSGARAAYHAASHYGAAFLCVLLDQGMKILEASGVQGEIPRKALLSLARSTLDALGQSDPAHAMAGVYARGDAGTAQRHLKALDAMDPQMGALYRELARRSIALAEESHRIDPAAAKALRQLLIDF
jgi:predicted short-subunit dehydrogenase-like oxidoreductase (DUF2520 family)